MWQLSLVEKGPPSRAHSFYKKRVQDCLALERRLLSLKAELLRFGIPLEEQPITDIHSQHADIIDAARAELEPLEKELTESVQFLRENADSIARLQERRLVLQAVRGGMIADVMRSSSGGSAQMAGDDLTGAASDDEEEAKGGRLPSAAQAEDADRLHLRNVLVGTIATEQQLIFSRMLYRVSRGNAFARFKELKPTAAAEAKSVFYAVLLGEQVTAKVRRVCDAFHVNLYAVPEGREEIRAQTERIKQELKDKREIETRTENSISALLSRLGSSDETGTTPLRDWQAAVAIERQIASTLMRAHFYLTMISIEGWVPASELQQVKAACKAAVQGTGNPPAAIEVDPANPIRIPDFPPTFFRLNAFTATFQAIVDTYGVPRYKEANPGLFTVISFPFLFGVMYGDIGHGTLLTLFALFLLYKEEALAALQRRGQLGEIPSMAFGGRYVLLMMGLFAVYCGMIYNDCLSIPLNVWGSSYTDPGGNSSYMTFSGSVYPIGVDPSWPHKQNSLAFFNSMKMKMAVSIGVTQMTFGILLSLSNHLYFHDTVSVYLEFIPRMVFMLSTFGYMVFMILYKWSDHCARHRQQGWTLPSPTLRHAARSPPALPLLRCVSLSVRLQVRELEQRQQPCSQPDPDDDQHVPVARQRGPAEAAVRGPGGPAGLPAGLRLPVRARPAAGQAAHEQAPARAEGRRLPVHGARAAADAGGGRRRGEGRRAAVVHHVVRAGGFGHRAGLVQRRGAAGLSLVQRRDDPQLHPHHRVRAGLRQQHGLLPPALGAVPRPRAAGRGLLGQDDPAVRHQHERRAGRHRGLPRLRRLVRGNLRRPALHGRPRVLPARPQAALGGVPEQVHSNAHHRPHTGAALTLPACQPLTRCSTSLSPVVSQVLLRGR